MLSTLVSNRYNMSSDNCLVIQVYWGGKIINEGGSISYDPSIPKQVLFLTEMVGYDDLVDKIYNLLGLDRNLLGRQNIQSSLHVC